MKGFAERSASNSIGTLYAGELRRTFHGVLDDSGGEGMKTEDGEDENNGGCWTKRSCFPVLTDVFGHSKMAHYS
jgi:hypothetical protein